ncbi:hypothetical protein, partial [Comamonas sp.]|uniref:hypothetical protein n=1 Tax=Comamonas sp. TaxID=34028 RepID=UPI0025897487
TTTASAPVLGKTTWEMAQKSDERSCKALLLRPDRSKGGNALHLFAMFIHHVFITGCADRGAWPWRKPALMTV